MRFPSLKDVMKLTLRKIPPVFSRLGKWGKALEVQKTTSDRLANGVAYRHRHLGPVRIH